MTSHCEQQQMINFIIWIIVGGLLGWIASLIMGTNVQRHTLMNIVVGIVGAFLAGWVLTILIGIAIINQNNFSMAALPVSLLGAVILLALLNFFRRGALR